MYEMGSQSWEDGHVPPEVKQNLEELFPGLTIEEALQHQVSFQNSRRFLSGSLMCYIGY